jgi:hypothetical protein
MRSNRSDTHRVVYQVRYGDGTEPHSLIASTPGDAFEQATALAARKGAPVMLFGDGVFIAKCPAQGAILDLDLPTGLSEALAAGGLNLVGWRRPSERDHETVPSGLN